jgi:hypothetical protein
MNEKYKKFIPLIIVGVIALIAVIVYIIKNQVGMATKASDLSTPADFWAGLWQGAIVVLAFIASLFDKNIELYEVNNTGFWYNFGFIFGLTAAMGGAKGTRGKKSSKEETTPTKE